MNTKNVLVLGATGFIGQYVTEQLKKTGNVIGYDRFLTDSDYPLIEGSFAEEKNFERILEEHYIDTVYHLIGTTVPKEDTSDIAGEVMENIVPTLRLLEAMRKVGTKRMVFASSGGTVYGESTGTPHTTADLCEPICGYGMQKLTIEQYLRFYNRRYGMECRIARLANPYGVPPKRPRGQGIIPIFIGKLLRNEPITMFGDTLRDYIHIHDAVTALVKVGAYEGEKEVFNIGTGVAVSISEIIEQIEKSAGRTFCAVERQPIRTCDVQESMLDISETVSELNWKPEIGLKAGILLTWEEMTRDRR